MVGNIIKDSELRDKVLISTLGSFDIKYGESSLLEGTTRSYKIWELFKYFLAFNNKKLVPENIVENLWPEEDYINPRNVLRTQIFRLRKLLDKSILSSPNKEFFKILFKNGYYIFEVADDCIIDTQLFEEEMHNAEIELQHDPDKACRHFKEAVLLYKGVYLPECLYNQWVLPIRHHYHRLYMDGLIKLLNLLKHEGNYDEIINYCEQAFLIEPLDERLHIYFIEALYTRGNEKEALNHYQYITAKLYKELGIAPSVAMKQLYKKIQYTSGQNSNKQYIGKDFPLLTSKLAGHEIVQGAMLCDVDTFQLIYRLEKRRALRKNSKVHLGLITMEAKRDYSDDQNLFQESMEKLKGVLLTYLRKGDLFAVWSQHQILVMLLDIEEKDIRIVTNRVERVFQDVAKDKTVWLAFKFDLVTPYVM